MFGHVIEGARVRLEPPRPEWSPIYQRWLADMEVTRYLVQRNPPTLRQEEALHTHSFPIEQAEDAIHALAGDIPGMNPVHRAIVPGAPRVPLPHPPHPEGRST
jgi:hypothetical protein